MNGVEIAKIQERIGTTPDGFWGAKSIDAVQAYLRSLMPEKNPWPAQDQTSLTRYYGEPGDESQLVNLPAPVPMLYEGAPIKTIHCHKKVADSLARILCVAYDVAPAIVRDYAGCFNNRPMRGGTLPSLHARGAAIDLAPGGNGSGVSWPVGSTMPLSVMECFAREGWLSAGAFFGHDAMHFQATI